MVWTFSSQGPQGPNHHHLCYEYPSRNYKLAFLWVGLLFMVVSISAMTTSQNLLHSVSSWWPLCSFVEYLADLPSNQRRCWAYVFRFKPTIARESSSWPKDSAELWRGKILPHRSSPLSCCKSLPEYCAKWVFSLPEVNTQAFSEATLVKMPVKIICQLPGKSAVFDDKILIWLQQQWNIPKEEVLAL